MTQEWQLQSASEGDSTRKEFTPGTEQNRLGELTLSLRVCSKSAAALEEAALR